MKFFVVCVLVAVSCAQVEISNAAGCDSFSCWRTCFSGGYISGFCQGEGDKCVCSGRRHSAMENPDIQKDEVAEECVDGACSRSCGSVGWAGGQCFAGSCQCFRFKSVALKSIQTNNIDPTPVVEKKLEDCEPKNCIIYCQKMGRIGGKCIGGRCWCI